MAENLKILGLASDDAGCGHYRLINPITALSQLGYDARWTMDPGEFERMAEDASVLILQRASLPWRDNILRWRRQGKLVVYELDDLIHDIPESSPVHRLYQHGSLILKNSVSNMSVCDGMIVSTMELERYYCRFNGNIVRIPNFIDFRLRDWDTPYPKVPGRICVGWVGGSQHQEEAPLLLEVLRWAARRYRHVDIALYCHPHFARYLLTLGEPIPPDRLLLLPVRRFADYPLAIGAMDIGLAPLTNIAFNRARCLDKDTAVWSPSGIRPVGSLKVGDWVWNGERYVHVLARQDEGSVLGLRVRLECGLTLLMTTDHRVLTSIGWLNAGRLRRGDSVLISVPHYAGGVVRHDAVRVALMMGLLYVRGLDSGLREDIESELGMSAQRVRRFAGEIGLWSIFDGWGDQEVRVFFNEFVRRFGVRNKRGELEIDVRHDLAQRFAEFALIVGQSVKATFRRNFVRFTLKSGAPPQYSRVVEISSYWLDAVDIQVEGELFCANGVVSHNSALKPLEYMARGAVCIASDIAEYRLLWKEGAPLLLARNPDEWKSHLARLIEDATYRSSLADTEWVRSHYDLHTNAFLYIQAIREFIDLKNRGVHGRGEYRPLRHYDRCPCGSGLKYSRCCSPAFG